MYAILLFTFWKKIESEYHNSLFLYSFWCEYVTEETLFLFYMCWKTVTPWRCLGPDKILVSVALGPPSNGGRVKQKKICLWFAYLNYGSISG